MTNGTNDGAITARQCWSCKGQVAVSDNFCRHCGAKLTHEANSATAPLPPLTSAIIHERLISIEKLLLKTLVGVGALLVLAAWIVLQTFHFGRQ
jgi:uncharacterized membrane protein YvbJ